jgi:hypothetical protein
MNTQSISRVSAGVPNGGQFAPTVNSQSDVALGGVPTAPAWDELQSRLDDAVTEWCTGLDENCATADVADLLGSEDEDAMIEAYGAERSDLLCSLRSAATVRGRRPALSTIARTAGVSRAWIYAQPALRARLQPLLDRRPTSTAQLPPLQRATDQSLRTRLELALRRNRQLARENSELRRDVENALSRIRSAQ